VVRDERGRQRRTQVANSARLTYDDRYLYACFRFADPHPELVRAPLGDHDNVSSSTDYAGVIVDSRNDSKTAMMFLSNPSGVQYDALSSDISGEDNSPDFYWDSAGKITATGWDLEIRIRSRRYAIRAIRCRRWGSCCTATIRAIGATSSSPHGCRAT
jgi:hypothetical protein